FLDVLASRSVSDRVAEHLAGPGPRGPRPVADEAPDVLEDGRRGVLGEVRRADLGREVALDPLSREAREIVGQPRIPSRALGRLAPCDDGRGDAREFRVGHDRLLWAWGLEVGGERTMRSATDGPRSL